MFHNSQILDDVGGLVTVRISGELAVKLKERTTISNSLENIRNTGEIARLISQLTGQKPAINVPKPPLPVPEPQTTPAQQTENTKRSTSQFYDFNPNRKPAQRKRENAETMAILQKIDAGEIDPAVS